MKRMLAMAFKPLNYFFSSVLQAYHYTALIVTKVQLLTLKSQFQYC